MLNIIINWMLLGAVMSTLCMIYVYASVHESSFKDAVKMWANGMRIAVSSILNMNFKEGITMIGLIILMYLVIWPFINIKMIIDVDKMKNFEN